MEIANGRTQQAEKLRGVRSARRCDAGAITALLQNAPHTHIHADWHYPADWLGSPGFVVVDETGKKASSGSMTNRLFGPQARIIACLAVAADPPPAAWVRVAAVSETVNAPAALAEMFSSIDEYLQQTAVSQLGWLLVEPWPQSWIRELGFEKIGSVRTFVREGTETPNFRSLPGLHFRPVKADDLESLARIETAAFQPLWRNSAAGLSLAIQHAFSFDVVVYEDRVVGYQCSTLMRQGAHLSRITIDPVMQGNGIGSALLAHAINGYRLRGVETISLNTQLDNLHSKRLYERFGFKPIGQRFPVWAIQYRIS